MTIPQWEACKVCGGDHWTKDHPGPTTDPRIAALAEALHGAQAGCPDNPTYDCVHERQAAAILAALPPDWCGHGLARELDLVRRLAAAEYQRDTLDARLRKIEEAARALDRHGFLDLVSHTSEEGWEAAASLRAALEADHD